MASRSYRLIQACAVVAIAAAGLFPVCAQAALVFSLNSTFNGISPTSTPPFLTARFTTIGPNTVQLDLASSLEVSSEFFGQIAFNVAPAIVPSSLTFTPFVSNTGFANPTVLATTNNGQNLQGGGSQAFGFDVLFDFLTGPPVNRFNGLDLAQFTITGVGITENSFNFTNSPADDLFIAAHLQGIPCGDRCTTSGAVTVGEQGVPEPGTLGLLGLGLLSIGAAAIRRRERY